MITDPVSTPNHPVGRLVWAALIGIIAHLFAQKYFTVDYHHLHLGIGSPIWALFILSFFTPLVDYFWKGAKFSWLGINEK